MGHRHTPSSFSFPLRILYGNKYSGFSSHCIDLRLPSSGILLRYIGVRRWIRLYPLKRDIYHHILYIIMLVLRQLDRQFDRIA